MQKFMRKNLKMKMCSQCAKEKKKRKKGVGGGGIVTRKIVELKNDRRQTTMKK